MDKKNNDTDKTLTVGDIYDVLLPALKEDFAVKKDIADFKEEFHELRNDLYTFEDKVLKQLNKLNR